ncbi:MAG: dihydroorotate dehydrogenase electron transfer subunit [Chloroflexota bacterium]
MKQVLVRVIDQHRVLPELVRSHGRTVLGSRVIWLRCPDIAGEARPGQYVMVVCGETCSLPRPFSIHRVKDDAIAILFSVLEDGKGTAWLSRRCDGDSVALFGPLGNGFAIETSAKNLLLVAGGIGLAPFYFLAQEAINQGRLVRLLAGAATASQCYPAEDMPAGTEAVICTDDGTAGLSGVVTGQLAAHTGWADQIFACGPLGMYRSMARMPELKGRPVQVSLEVRMGCGLGVCYGCTVRTRQGLKQVCRDGPVFEMEDIIWEEMAEV